MSALGDLLLQHLRDVRSLIAEATVRADALEVQLDRLKNRADGPAAYPVARVKPDGWSAEEDAVLRENYPQIGAVGCMKLLPHRSNVAIRVRASRNLGVAFIPSKKPVWCQQCERRVPLCSAAKCSSPFCKARELAA